MRPMVEIDAFEAVDLRVGIITGAEALSGARVPAIALKIDFGPLGTLQSSARLTRRYTPEVLIGRRVVALVNVPPRRVAGWRSDVLVLGGVPPERGAMSSSRSMVEQGSDGSAPAKAAREFGRPVDVSLLSIDHDDVPPGTPVA